jgi:beta-glucosidase/6-phospho-beta-glucosidase/beta-galactosidase
VWITENGWTDRGEIEDHGRIKYYRDHLKAVQAAKVIDGCNVQRFTFLSLIDHFEWMRGYSERFGIYSVDFNSPTRERTPKLSAEFVKKIIRQRQPQQDGDCTYWTISQTEDENLKFPGSFMFGAATASYQIEGAWNVDGKGPSIWGTVTHNFPDRISDASTGDVAANSYELYPRDIEMIKNLGVSKVIF